jgi:N-acyl-D-aspartate/D-glutamate deacylase
VTFRRLWRETKRDLTALKAALSDPSNKALILKDMSEFDEKNGKDLQGGALLRNKAGAMIPKWMLTCQGIYPWHDTYEPPPESSVSAQAKRMGRGPLDIAYDLLLDTEGPHAGALWRVLFGYEGNNEKIRKALEMYHVIPGFDDAGAHCSVLTDATAGTHLISYWARDRNGQKIPVQLAVQKQTGEAAALFGLDDRGVLKPGKRADINVLDFDKLRVKKPYFAKDFPTGAGRWLQYSEGYRMTLTRGVVTFENDQHTGALPGRLVRNPKAVGVENATSVPALRDMGDVSTVDLTDHAVGVSSADTAGLSAIARTLRKSEETVKEAARSRL